MIIITTYICFSEKASALEFPKFLNPNCLTYRYIKFFYAIEKLLWVYTQDIKLKVVFISKFWIKVR